MANIQINQLPESTDISSEDFVHIKKTDLVDYKMKQKNLMLIGIQDTKANLTLLNPVLKRGQFSLETDTKVVKLGDGITPYNLLSNLSGFKYDSTIRTSPFTAELNTIYFVDTTLGTFDITPPSPIGTGSWFGIVDYAGTFQLNNAKLVYSANKYNGVSEDLFLDLKFLSIAFSWTGSNVMGWRTV